MIDFNAFLDDLIPWDSINEEVACGYSLEAVEWQPASRHFASISPLSYLEDQIRPLYTPGCISQIPPRSRGSFEFTSQVSQAKFECVLCTKTFDRSSRAEACFNLHLGARPHLCKGACGNPNWCASV